MAGLGCALAVALIVVGVLGCRADSAPAQTAAPGSAPRAVPLMPPFAPLTSPGAEIDRVGIPAGYGERFTLAFENDRVPTHDVHVAYINAAGAEAREGQPFPYDTIIVLEIYPATLTATGQIARDASGHFLRGDLATIFVMRKEPGFGAKYGSYRSGEWEYGDYGPDGSFGLAPEMTHVCAQCHLAQSNPQQDWLIGENRFFAQHSTVAPGAAHATLLAGLIPLALIASAPLLALALIAGRLFRSRS